MPAIEVNGRHFECGAIIFDKDGTLIDFHRIWGGRARRAVSEVTSAIGGDTDSLTKDIFRTIGYQPETGRTSGTGPLATAPLEKFYVVVATILHQHGMDWDDAEHLVQMHVRPAMSEISEPDDIKTLADIRKLFATLRTADIRLAVATTDNRDATEALFKSLQVSEFVEVLLCGDDSHCEPKPSARVFQYVSEFFSIPTKKIAIVGDTIGDMLTGRNGKAGLKIGVCGGASSNNELADHADVIIQSVADISVAGPRPPREVIPSK